MIDVLPLVPIFNSCQCITLVLLYFVLGCIIDRVVGRCADARWLVMMFVVWLGIKYDGRGVMQHSFVYRIKPRHYKPMLVSYQTLPNYKTETLSYS